MCGEDGEAGRQDSREKVLFILSWVHSLEMVRIIKPDVVGHVSVTTGGDRKTVTRRRHAIYSVDVQPGAQRLFLLFSSLIEVY